VTGLVFARKELHEILRTWRIWVLPGIVLFFAITGPLVARFTPELVGAVVGSSLNGLKLPTPTYFDSYAQWVKNLSQILLVAVIIVYGGLVSGEVRSGTVVLVLTKPLSRQAFITIKAAVHSLFLAAIVTIGTLLTWALTWLVFGSAPGSDLWKATGVFLALGMLFVCLMTLFSSLIRSAAGAAGAGLAAYVVLAIAAIWKPPDDYSPAALTTQPASLAAGKDVPATWPIVTALLVAIALVVLAGWIFRRQDL
jgi:ABC-2 type transport system permease protein